MYIYRDIYILAIKKRFCTINLSSSSFYGDAGVFNFNAFRVAAQERRVKRSGESKRN